MTNCEFYNKSYTYILKRTRSNGIDETELKKYFKPCNDLKGFSSENDIRFVYYTLVDSLQDSGYRNFIKMEDMRPAFEELLCEFHPKCTTEKYKTEDDLLKAAVKDNRFEINDKNTKAWKDFFRSILSGANFLKDFNNRQELQMKLSGTTEKPNELNVKLAMVKKVKAIYGIGDALAANFLREIDIVDLGKPDVHIRNVFKEVFPGISEEPADEIPAKDIHERLDEISKATGITAYQIDRIIWLICTENFYLHNKGRSKRQLFINDIMKGDD